MSCLCKKNLLDSEYVDIRGGFILNSSLCDFSSIVFLFNVQYSCCPQICLSLMSKDISMPSKVDVICVTLMKDVSRIHFVIDQYEWNFVYSKIVMKECKWEVLCIRLVMKEGWNFRGCFCSVWKWNTEMKNVIKKI